MRWATPTATFEWGFSLATGPTAHRCRPRSWCTAITGWENLIIDGSGPCRGAGLGAGTRRRGIRRPGLVLHPRPGGFGAPRQPRGRRPGQHRELFCARLRGGQRGLRSIEVAMHWWLVLATLRWGVILPPPGGAPLEAGRSVRWSWRRFGRRVLRDRVGSARPPRRGRARERRSWPPDPRPNSSRRQPSSSNANVREGDQRAGQLPRPGGGERVCAWSNVNCSMTTTRPSARALVNLGFADEGRARRSHPRRRAGRSPPPTSTACLRALVRQRLAVAHPGYAQGVGVPEHVRSRGRQHQLRSPISCFAAIEKRRQSGGGSSFGTTTVAVWAAPAPAGTTTRARARLRGDRLVHLGDDPAQLRDSRPSDLRPGPSGSQGASSSSTCCMRTGPRRPIDLSAGLQSLSKWVQTP